MFGYSLPPSLARTPVTFRIKWRESVNIIWRTLQLFKYRSLNLPEGVPPKSELCRADAGWIPTSEWPTNRPQMAAAAIVTDLLLY
jgi:hypothetical protein